MVLLKLYLFRVDLLNMRLRKFDALISIETNHEKICVYYFGLTNVNRPMNKLPSEIRKLVIAQLNFYSVILASLNHSELNL